MLHVLPQSLQTLELCLEETLCAKLEGGARREPGGNEPPRPPGSVPPGAPYKGEPRGQVVPHRTLLTTLCHTIAGTDYWGLVILRMRHAGTVLYTVFASRGWAWHVLLVLRLVF